MKKLMLAVVILALALGGCSQSGNLFSSIDNAETVQVLVYEDASGTHYVDLDEDGSYETPLTREQYEALRLQVAASGGSIKVVK